MNESDLIKRYREIIFLIPDKESRLKYADDPSNLLRDLNSLKLEKDTVATQLKTCQDKSITLKKLENVRAMLTALYNKFSRNDYPHKFSRDQGLIIHAFILIKIAEDISYAIDHNISVPSDYYLEIGGDFDCKEIVRILRESIDYLKNHQISNYVELLNFVRSVQKQIVTLDDDCGRMLI